MKNVSDKNYRENQNTFYVKLCFSENLAVYDNLKKKTEPDRPRKKMYLGSCALHAV
jgi:hypothetical protein